MVVAAKRLSLIAIALLLANCAEVGNEPSEQTGDAITTATGKAKGLDSREGLQALAGAAAPRRARGSDVAADARAYAEAAASRSGVGSPSFSELDTRVGSDGRTHVRLQQMHDGVPVWGADVVVHATAQDLVGLAGSIATGLERLPTRSARRSSADVLGAARRDVFGGVVIATEREEVTPVVFVDAAGAPRHAFHTSFYNELEGGFGPGLWNHIIDAETGAILARWNALHTAQASGPGGNPRVTNTWSGALDVEPEGDAFVMTTSRLRTTNMANGQSGDGAAVVKPLGGFEDPVVNDAHGYAEITLDMMKTWMGHDSIDDNGFKIHSRVHYGVNYENAFWNGTQMTYGDGKTTFYPLSGAIDVVAHEIHHGFTAKHSNLAYSGEPGGLNESFSDIAGKAAEFFYKASPTWDLGADIYRAADSALRYMCNPSRDGSSIEHASSMTPSLDPHYSSGPMNKMFCRLSKRLSSGDAEGTATAAGVRRAAKPFYLANASYWTSSTTFTQACQGTVDAARALGYSADEIATIQTSWNDVGIYCDGVIAPPPPCDETLTSESGVLTSPNWPNNYGNSFARTWCIDAPAGRSATLRFSDFDTEAGFDFVSVGDKSGNFGAKASGFVAPAAVTSERIYVTFKTDSIVAKKGWRATWSTQ